MKTKSRITSILQATNLDFSITGFQAFNLLKLDIASDIDFELPTNLRLGHLAEKIVSELTKASTNYKVLYENIQVIKDKKTIGEIDFIIKNNKTNIITHMELAYKFYLYDPTISLEPLNNWIGPNRNDSLYEKLEKLKNKQFPLLYNSSTKLILNELEINKVSQALCLLVSLYVPYKYKSSFNSVYKKAVKGYYISFENFIDLDTTSKNYYLPSKKEWGMEPSENNIWYDFNGVEDQIELSIKEKQALLCWQKKNNLYESFFIVWW